MPPRDRTDVDRLLPLRPVTFQILLTLAGGERHGYGITQDIAGRTSAKMRLEPGNLYRSLRTMLDDGLIEESERRPAPDLDDERRRYYRITPLGRRVAAAEIARLEAVFADRLREARRKGRFAVAVLWLRSVADVAAHATAERRIAHATSTRSGGHMSGFGSDVVTALRGLIRRPGFTFAIGLMLAVGLGFNTALFAVVQSVLLRPLPYVKPDRIMMLWTGRNPDGTGSVNSYADYLTWKEQSHSFESLATYNISFATLTDAGDPEEIGGSVVSPEFFHVLRVPMALGRGIEPGDEVVPPDAGRPIIIAHSLWQRRFHGDPAIVGKTLTLAGRQRRIVGVVAHEFIHPEPFWGELAEYWSPLTVTDSMRTQHGNHYLRVIGRLADGATPAGAGAEMDHIGRELMKSYPTTNTASVVVASLHDELIGDTRPLLWMFFGALVLVLSLAVANIVNLLLARTSRRRAELLIRSALGASRGRLMTQLIVESVMMGLLGGVMGLAFAEIG